MCLPDSPARSHSDMAHSWRSAHSPRRSACTACACRMWRPFLWPPWYAAFSGTPSAWPPDAWRAVRDGELAAAAFGVNVGYYKTLAFAISAAYAGVAGSLYGLATAFVSTDAFPFQLSIALLVGAVVGGIGTIGGALIGGLLTEFLPILAQQL